MAVNVANLDNVNFNAISSILQVLTDPDKRKTYDKHGEEGLKQNNQGFGGDPFESFSR